MQTTEPKLHAIALNLGLLLCMLGGSTLAYLYRETLEQAIGMTYLGITLICFIGNASVLLPSPSLLVVASASTFLQPFPVALCGAIGATCGEVVGYYTGRYSSVVVGRTSPRVAAFFDRYGLWSVFLFAFLPMPFFDVVGILAGYSRTPLPWFFLACFGGKVLKMLLYALFGAQLAALLPV
jgi:membrane protein DedA with SNARE-associated domain